MIEDAIIEFAPGFNVITGETGAGKTMVLTGLSLILGGKADVERIRSGAERLHASGRFLLPEERTRELHDLIAEHDPELESGALLLARSLSKDGKSRAQLSGSQTTASALSQFGEELIAIHGQHANLQLSKAQRQRELLDDYGKAELNEVQTAYQEKKRLHDELLNRLSELRSAMKTRDKQIEELRDLAENYARIKPKVNELQEIESIISRMESKEELRFAATTAANLLDDEESGALGGVNSARRHLQSLTNKDPQIGEIHARLESAYFELVDASSDLSRYLSEIEVEGISLDDAQSRRAELASFAKRFGEGSDKYEAFDDALSKGSVARDRISDLNGGDERLRELESELHNAFSEMKKAAMKLSAKRSELAKELSAQVTREIAELAMPDGIFECRVEMRDPDQLSSYQSSGIDDVAMLFTSHGGELLPIAKAASGGELSRLMLAVEVVVAGKRPLGTYVFDEVDAGIGGKAALEVGKRLRALAQEAQVIVVTHLPQVAIWADHHLIVAKDGSGAVTESSVTVADDRRRELEIARMLSGLEDSEHAQEHARELLELRKEKNG